MAPKHAGFPADGIKLLGQLSRNNTTEWFHAPKSDYQNLVKAPFIELVKEVNEALNSFGPRYRALKPESVSRPNRDTRFSKDKSPYRTDISITFPCDGLEKHRAAGFYLSIGPDGASILGGVYMPGTDELRALRKFVAAKHSTLTGIVKRVEKVMGPMQGEALKRVPKEFPADHPAADYLRATQMYFERSLARDVATSTRLLPEITDGFRAMIPVVDFLNEGLGN